MKIGKILAGILAIIAMGAVVTGCGSNSDKKKVIDIDVTTKSIVAETTFLGEIIEMSPENVGILYSAYDKDIIEGVRVYSCASKAYAEEVAIFKAKDAQSVSKIEEMVKTRVADLIKEYESYVPAEMTKLNSPYIDTNGEYVVLILADDTSNGKAVFEKAFK